MKGFLGTTTIIAPIVLIILTIWMSLAQAQSNMYGRYGQDAREYGEPCWSAAVSKCVREQRGGVARATGKLAKKRVTQ